MFFFSVQSAVQQCYTVTNLCLACGGSWCKLLERGVAGVQDCLSTVEWTVG